MMLLKKLCMVSWLPKLMQLIPRYQILVDYFFKTQYNSDKKNLDKKIEDINEKIPDTSELIEKTD